MSKRILVISDLHCPYVHLSAFKFLSAIKKKYKPDRIILMGDEIDWQSISFHEKNGDLLSPKDELETAIKQLQLLYKLFPKADVLHSNHGSLVLRKTISAGLPSQVIKASKEILRAPKGWNWRGSLTIKASDGRDIHFLHGSSPNSLLMGQTLGMNYVQGHIHSKFSIQYWANPKGVYWALQTPCLIDNASLAFSYNKLDRLTPLLGCAIIIDGIPKLLPMEVDKKGKWKGKVP